MTGERKQALAMLAGQAVGPFIEWALTEYDGQTWDVIYAEAASGAVGVAEHILEIIDGLDTDGKPPFTRTESSE